MTFVLLEDVDDVVLVVVVGSSLSIVVVQPISATKPIPRPRSFMQENMGPAYYFVYRHNPYIIVLLIKTSLGVRIVGWGIHHGDQAGRAFMLTPTQ